MFQRAQDDQYFQVIMERVRTLYLTWCEQFLDLIEEHVDLSDGPLILNDLGCQVGQFAKSLVRRNLPLTYRGYDIEPQYLEAARELFPDLEFRPLDLHEETPDPAHITVISATLEHLPNLERGLVHLLSSTRQTALIRTFLADSAALSWYSKEDAEEAYRIHQFRFADFEEICTGQGFKVTWIEDRYTGSRPKDLGQGVTRTQHIALAERRT
ncbi:MAG: class I SAM-dependent methyltransferase [Acidobacteriota bacterium]|nr:class I SAM-dependent methyltransferase [Acidobacteriota bacterium]